MVTGPLRLLNRIISALTAGIMSAMVIGGGLAHAASFFSSDPNGGYILYFGVFSAWAFALILWMLWDRQKIRNRLHKAEEQNHLHGLLHKSRHELSLIWDEKGQPPTYDDLCHWLEIDNEGTDLTCLRGEGGIFSDAQFDEFTACLTRLHTEGVAFHKLFFLKNQKRNIMVSGTPLIEGDNARGVIVHFRDATYEENIAAFQKRNINRINSQLEFFESTSNLIHFPLWVRDKDLKLIWVNKAYVAAVEGENREQVIAEGLELVASSLGRNALDMAALSKESNQAHSEKHFVVIKGERRAVDIHHIPIRVDEKHIGSMGYAQDITDLENARGELVHHTESHSETLNKLSTAVAIFTSGQRLEYYNSAFSRLWHLPEELLFSHPRHGEILEAMRKARRLPEQANFPAWKAEQLEAYTRLLEPVEEMWHLPDNTSLRVVSQPHPLGGLLIFYEDVTDHFALERSYNTLFAVQEETLNNLHEGVVVFGIDGCLQLYNEAFTYIWDLKRDMLDGNPHAGDVMAACAENYGNSAQMEALTDLIVGGEAKKTSSSGQLKRQGGSVLNYSAVPLPDGAMLITFIDVSDSFAIERVLRQRNQALEEADKIKTDFLAHMSYELRTPLNSIIGFSELLQKEYQGPLNDVQHEYMHSILSASGQLLELFNDILDLSVIEAGGLTLDIDEFELPDVLAQVTAQLQERITAKDIDLICDYDKDLKPVWGDVKRIQHTIYNLLSNAVKFTPSLGIITLSVSQDDQNYIIVVKDSGMGIKFDEISRIFEKFFTGSNVHNGQGAGLGLSLVKSFVDFHGGKIDVQSSLNVGTEITINMPIRVGMDAQISMVSE
ncbi:FIG056333: sensor [hydrothermal vent metagenome]|uniref:histidine kinase n=1 Tax=hydrothermal vent metagenome TaxID=652676 RepID=A0A3B0RXM0_9ZZZZ